MPCGKSEESILIPRCFRDDKGALFLSFVSCVSIRVPIEKTTKSPHGAGPCGLNGVISCHGLVSGVHEVMSLTVRDFVILISMVMFTGFLLSI